MLGSRCEPILFHTHSVNIQHMIRYYIDSTIYQNNKLRNHVDCIQLKTITIKELKHKPLETRLEVSLPLIKITSSFTAINFFKKNLEISRRSTGQYLTFISVQRSRYFYLLLMITTFSEINKQKPAFFSTFFLLLEKIM